jgi:hypothetical protein
MREGKQRNLLDRIYRFHLSAEFNQFFIQDELADAEVDWTEEEGRVNLALNDGIIAVGTNCDRVVPVEVQILSSEPPCNIESWDHLVDCTIHVTSGRLAVYGCCEDLTTAARINLDPGRYMARVCYGNQYSCDDHIFCADYYVVVLWRSNAELFQVLKRRVDVFYELIG